MALSGSYRINGGYQGSYMLFSWTATQSIVNNTSTINWRLTGGFTNGGYVMAGGFKVIIDGETVYSKPIDYRIPMYTGTVIADGTKTLSHRLDGVRAFNVYCEAGIHTYAINSSGSATFTLDTIRQKAVITSAPNFTDEESPTITYTNTLGAAVTSLQACIADDSGGVVVRYRDIPKTDASYTFELTTKERDSLRTLCANAQSIRVRFYIKNVINGNTFYSYLTKTLSIVNAEPIISPTIADTNAATVALTGDSNVLVKYFSNAAVTMGVSPQKQATITSKKVVNGGKTLTEDGTFNNVESGDFVFTAVDSRGLITTLPINRNFIEYINPSCDIEVSMGATGTLNLSVSGNYFNGSFNGITKNKLIVQYRVNMGQWKDIKATASGNTYSATYEDTGYDYQKTYTVQARIIDSLSTAFSAEVKTHSIPVCDWGENDFNFNVPITIQGNPLVYITDEGTKNGWYYRNWSNGMGECWKVLSHTTTISTAFGTMYVGTATTRQSYPFPFEGKPVEQATLQSGGAAAWLIPESRGNGVNSSSQTAMYNVVHPNSITKTGTYYISFYCYGKLLAEV